MGLQTWSSIVQNVILDYKVGFRRGIVVIVPIAHEDESLLHEKKKAAS